MNKTNLKIARELNRIAKDLVAVVPHGGHSSKFETDATDPKLVQEMQDLLDTFRDRMIAYNELRDQAKNCSNEIEEFGNAYRKAKQRRLEFEKKLESDPALKELNEAHNTLLEVGRLAAKSGVSLKALIAGITVEVRKSQTPGYKFAMKFQEGVIKARMLEQEMTDFLDLCTKRVVEIRSKTVKEFNQDYDFYLGKADEYREKINDAVKQENARRKEQGEPLLKWEEIEKWQDGMKQEMLNKKGRGAGVGDWIKKITDSTKKLFSNIVVRCKNLVKDLLKLIGRGEKVNKDIDDLKKYFA